MRLGRKLAEGTAADPLADRTALVLDMAVPDMGGAEPVAHHEPVAEPEPDRSPVSLGRHAGV